MKKQWDLRVRFLIEADDAPEAWTALYEILPETDDVLIAYDSMVPAEEHHTSGETAK